MTLTRTAPIKRGKALPVARKGKRRTRSPLPLPPADGSPATPHSDEGEAVAFGAQAELCRATECAACFATLWAVAHAPAVVPVDWAKLPRLPRGMRSEAHHEPPRGLRSASDDDDTIPLCARHHGRKGEPVRSFAVRHSARFDRDPAGFYTAANIGDHTAVRDEMRRRTQELGPHGGG